MPTESGITLSTSSPIPSSISSVVEGDMQSASLHKNLLNLASRGERSLRGGVLLPPAPALPETDLASGKSLTKSVCGGPRGLSQGSTTNLAIACARVIHFPYSRPSVQVLSCRTAIVYIPTLQSLCLDAVSRESVIRERSVSGREPK